MISKGCPPKVFRLGITIFWTVALALAAGCRHWQKNAEVAGVNFQKVRTEANGYVIGYMGTDAVIAGRPCQKGWVQLHSNEVPAGFTASRTFRLGTFSVPPGTWVFQNPSGVVTVCAFPGNVEIQGHVCRGSGGAEGVQTAFYSSGRLKQFFAPIPVEIDGTPCGASIFQPGIELYESGQLRSATLSRDATIDGQLHKKGERIRLSADGRVTTPR